MGASADAALPRDIPAMLNNVLGTRLRVVAGYAGSREVMIAVERNEVQGMCGISWASLSMQHSDWIDSGFITILEQDDTKGHPGPRSERHSGGDRLRQKRRKTGRSWS